MRTTTLLSMLVLLALVAAGCASVSSANSDDILPQRTRTLGAGIPNQRPTLDTGHAQATAQALATNAHPDYQLTAQSIANYALTPNVDPDAIFATVEAYATQIAVNPAEVEAVISQLLASLPDDVDAATLEETLTYWLSMGNVSATIEGHNLSLTMTYSETGINAILEAALVAAGRDGMNMNVDLVSGGAVVDLVGYTTQDGKSGTLSLYVLLTAVNGRIQIELVSASFNDITVPDRLLSDIEALLIDSVANALYEYLGVTLNSAMPYSIDSLLITETNFTATVTVTLS